MVSTSAARWLSAAVLLTWFGLSPLLAEGVAAASPSEGTTQSASEASAEPAGSTDSADSSDEPEDETGADDGVENLSDAADPEESLGDEAAGDEATDDSSDDTVEELTEDTTTRENATDDDPVQTDPEDRDSGRDPRGVREALDNEPANAEPAGDEPANAEPPDVDPLSAEPAGDEPTSSPAGTSVVPAEPVTTVRDLVAARPVTARSIVTDLLTWVGLRPDTDGLPVPAAPVPALVESLWLVVRQTQYVLNNQRPTAQVTVSGPGPDGTITGGLNAVDYDDATLTYLVTAAPAHGSVIVDASGAFTYTPDVAGRADRFTVTVDDTVGNPFHLHGLLGLLGITGPTQVVVTIDGASARAASANESVAPAGGFGERVVTDVADAAEMLNALAPLLGAEPGFAAPSDITADRAGAGAGVEHFYRYTETIGGITVLGSDIILVTDAHGTVTGLFDNYIGLDDAFDVDPDQALDEPGEVRRLAGLAHLGAAADDQTVETFLAHNTFSTTLVVYALERHTEPALAWQVVVQFPDTGDLSPSGATYVIDADGADAGTVIVTVSTAQGYSVTSVGTDWRGGSRTITVDRGGWLFPSYAMVDDVRNIATYSTSYSFFGLGGPVLPGRVIKRGWLGWNRGAVSAHANTAVAYDFFDDVLGRTSFDGAGALVEVSIRYNPVNPYRVSGYANAFWDPTRQQFAYGDGGYLQAALDVVAHEFTHAVVSHVVGTGGSVLDYGESGALNEAYADILGLLVEGKTGTDRWLIGEDSDYGIIRNLADPTSVRTGLGPYRDHYSTRYTGTGDDAGEHVNSTIFGHAAYLMMTDAATAGVSDDSWARVFYHSLFRLSRSAIFVDGRAAVLSAATAQGFTDAQLAAIRAAFDDVGIAGAAASAVLVA